MIFTIIMINSKPLCLSNLICTVSLLGFGSFVAWTGSFVASVAWCNFESFQAFLYMLCCAVIWFRFSLSFRRLYFLLDSKREPLPFKHKVLSDTEQFLFLFFWVRGLSVCSLHAFG